MPRFRWNRLTQFSLLGLLVITTLVAIGLRWQKSMAEQQALAPLRSARLKAAQDWWTCLNVQFSMGRYNTQEYDLASKALKDAELDAAQTHEERIQALTEHCARLEARLKEVTAMFQVGAAGGEAERRAEAELRLIEAKMQLIAEEYR